MKKIALSLLFLMCYTSVFSQANFEKGYIINNNDEVIDCYVKNLKWNNNPSTIQYKINSDDDIDIEVGVDKIKGFGIGDSIKYIRYTVEVDKSSDKMANLSNVKAPEFATETQFLKVLVEGKASLYSYRLDNANRFFYSVDESDLKQLIYKKYKSDRYTVATNEEYKGQLFKLLKCNQLSVDDFKNLDYDRADMAEVFVKYNECTGSENKNYEVVNREKWGYNLKAKAGISSASVGVSGPSEFSTVDFDDKINIAFGAEFEIVIPYNNNKWSFFIEPTYISYSNDVSFTIRPGAFSEFQQEASIEYSYIEMPVGVRCSFYLNNNSKLFINGAYVTVFDINKDLDILLANREEDLKSRSNLMFGVGYSFKNKLSIEFRVYTERELADNNNPVSISYNNYSAVLGYTIF